MAEMRVERLDHLGTVAGVSQEIELAGYLDALAGLSQQGNVGFALAAAHILAIQMMTLICPP